ncbi:MAG: Bax inhibitor-1/YccA family protein [Firmicutes bacterium]|uniref:Modulator of FtsH protease n=1 Tax=Melghirimyces thermohalophilus TaxID=1236220 RepID=A0A1G6N6J9_9BACL|nr:Bax inhibitor-1/YccA family protein [Melghirimyces thermohalophilus]MDA8352787.1 Bax inhibitor-1/YccA family protein [Bacillota bacterium]SDC63017.1 hypothetical protein SAMN04488112_1124 [Melghirimyces thermohalophilus]
METSVSRSHAGLMTRVFSWMFAALSLTAIISALLIGNDQMVHYFYENVGVLYGLFIAELVLVFFLAARVHRMAVGTATFVFFLYATLNGVTLTPLVYLYTAESLATVFFVTAGMFGAFALYGAVTKRDLSRMGNILIMALIGLILASIVNWFLGSSTLYWVITYLLVIVFCGLTAFDIQKIKAIRDEQMDEDTHTKTAILGALTLYLDFINLFILLLRILGNRD